jgi:type I restriction enzyme S subunit
MRRVAEIRNLRDESVAESSALFHAFLRSRFADIAAAHASHGLGDVADIMGGQSLPKGTTEDPGSHAVLLLKVADMNLQGNEVVASAAREYVSKPPKGRVLPAGTVVFPKRGGAIATNKKRLLGRPALLDPNLMGLVPKSGAMRPGFLLAWLETVDLVQLSNGGVIPQLNKKDLEPLTIPCPSLALQDEYLDEIDEARRATTGLLEGLRSSATDAAVLARAVLSDAFAGAL